MKVLIVSKTRMGPYLCVGGLTETSQSVRLLQPNGQNQPLDTPFNVGDVWDVNIEPLDDCVPPHVEDVRTTPVKRLRQVADIRTSILRHVTSWSGDLSVAYDGLLRFTSSGAGYIAEWGGIPRMSTGFWVADADLVCILDPKIKYRYFNPRSRREVIIPYVGVANWVERIPTGTLIRLSLARWWRPDDADPSLEERCYLQLSGWYGI